MAESEHPYSAYYQQLDAVAKARYREKLAMLGPIKDPYLPSEEQTASAQWNDWPEVQYPDMFNYLIATASPYTRQELKAYKSLEGYRQYADGWVTDLTVIRILTCSNAYLITARVKHSQKLSVIPVKAWVAVEQSGIIICAHCDCMAGLGEACSHISAILSP